MKRIAAIILMLGLPGCAYNQYSQIDNLAECGSGVSCSKTVPGSGYGPPHQAATGSSTEPPPQL